MKFEINLLSWKQEEQEEFSTCEIQEVFWAFSGGKFITVCDMKLTYLRRNLPLVPIFYGVPSHAELDSLAQWVIQLRLGVYFANKFLPLCTFFFVHFPCCFLVPNFSLFLYSATVWCLISLSSASLHAPFDHKFTFFYDRGLKDSTNHSLEDEKKLPEERMREEKKKAETFVKFRSFGHWAWTIVLRYWKENCKQNRFPLIRLGFKLLFVCKTLRILHKFRWFFMLFCILVAKLWAGTLDHHRLKGFLLIKLVSDSL